MPVSVHKAIFDPVRFLRRNNAVEKKNTALEDGSNSAQAQYVSYPCWVMAKTPGYGPLCETDVLLVVLGVVYENESITRTPAIGGM